MPCAETTFVFRHMYSQSLPVFPHILGEEIKYKLDNVVQVTHLIGAKARTVWFDILDLTTEALEMSIST